jgi:hypothetical protein
VRIQREDPEDDFERGEEKGRIDIRFVYAFNCREDVYFAFECKRLNLPSGKSKKSLATEYIEEGMMRFVTSQYASALRHGGMLGYVMNGDIDGAMATVKRSVSSRTNRLKMTPRQSLCRSMLIPDNPHVRETFHKLGSRVFRLQHLFLSLG